MAAIDNVRNPFITLLNAVSADGVSSPFEYMHDSKSLNVYVTGDLGGGSISFEALAPNGVWVPIIGDPIDAVGLYDMSGFPFVARAVLSGASAANVTVIVQGFVREIEE